MRRRRRDRLEQTKHWLGYLRWREQRQDEEPIHLWFGLTYANYLVLQRSILQSMPIAWQRAFVALLDEVQEASQVWADREGVELPEFQVTAREGGRYIQDPVPNYNRGRTRPDLSR